MVAYKTDDKYATYISEDKRELHNIKLIVRHHHTVNISIRDFYESTINKY